MFFDDEIMLEDAPVLEDTAQSVVEATAASYLYTELAKLDDEARKEFVESAEAESLLTNWLKTKKIHCGLNWFLTVLKNVNLLLRSFKNTTTQQLNLLKLVNVNTSNLHPKLKLCLKNNYPNKVSTIGHCSIVGFIL